MYSSPAGTHNTITKTHWGRMLTHSMRKMWTACLHSLDQRPRSPPAHLEAPNRTREPILVSTHTGRTTNLNATAEPQQLKPRSHLLKINRTHRLNCIDWTLLTVLIFLHDFHQIFGMQINFMFGRLSEVCDRSVGVQYDGARNLWVVKHNSLF